MENNNMNLNNGVVVNPNTNAQLNTVQVNAGNQNLSNNIPNVNNFVNQSVPTDSTPKKKKEKMPSSYIWTFVFVGFVLVIAILLLVFLLGGKILNRNRLVCYKNTQEVGYTSSVERVYKFDGTGFTRVYDTYIHSYPREITDEFFNNQYSAVLESTNGVTEFGFNTIISKKNNNVIIDAYTISMNTPDKESAKQVATASGFICD